MVRQKLLIAYSKVFFLENYFFQLINMLEILLNSFFYCCF